MQEVPGLRLTGDGRQRLLYAALALLHGLAVTVVHRQPSCVGAARLPQQRRCRRLAGLG
jgi:hypothetical protein